MTNEQTNLQNQLKETIQQILPELTIVKEVNGGNIIELANPENYIKHELTRESYFRKGETVTDIWWTGITLNIEETYRSNGTEENKSFYLRVISWEQHSGTGLFSVKIQQRFSENKKLRLINQAIQAYKEAVGA